MIDRKAYFEIGLDNYNKSDQIVANIGTYSKEQVVRQVWTKFQPYSYDSIFPINHYFGDKKVRFYSKEMKSVPKKLDRVYQNFIFDTGEIVARYWEYGKTAHYYYISKVNDIPIFAYTVKLANGSKVIKNVTTSFFNNNLQIAEVFIYNRTCRISEFFYESERLKAGLFFEAYHTGIPMTESANIFNYAEDGTFTIEAKIYAGWGIGERDTTLWGCKRDYSFIKS